MKLIQLAIDYDYLGGGKEEYEWGLKGISQLKNNDFMFLLKFNFPLENFCIYNRVEKVSEFFLRFG